MNNVVLDKLPDDFDWEVYCKLNADVKAAYKTRELVEKHYLTDGHKQHRKYKFDKSKLPSDFDWELYLLINPDIQRLYSTELLAQLHYTMYGYIDKRAYNFHCVPYDFCCSTYIELNRESIDKYYLQSDNHTKLHYELFGCALKLTYKDDFFRVPYDFDWRKYITLNESLPKGCNTDLKCRQHYHHHGIYQQLKYNDSCGDIIINQHPVLFHKYSLNIVDSTDCIPYKIDMFFEKICAPFSMILHIHCYDLNNFTTYFGKYWMIIQSKCPNVIITYCVGDLVNLKYYKCVTVLQCKNKGMDIGGKFTCVYHLNKYNIQYDYIFFIHSKSDKEIRELYIEPIIDNIQYIIQKISRNSNIGVVVPPLIYMGDYATVIYKQQYTKLKSIAQKWNFGNSLYMTDFDKYMGLDNQNYIFPEGNCFVCKWDVAMELYSDLKIYQVLNTSDSFDAVWVQSYYGHKQQYNMGKTIFDWYDFFNTCNDKPIYPNNIAWGVGHNGHPDNMIEHGFERLIFKVAQKLKYNICIIPYIDCPEHVEKIQHIEDEINIMLHSKTKNL